MLVHRPEPRPFVRLPAVAEPEPFFRAVDDLIGRANEHPLGLEFLKDGALDSVSAIFGVHAFVVDAARERLESLDG